MAKVKATMATLNSQKSKLKRSIILNKMAHLHTYMTDVSKDLSYFSEVDQKAKKCSSEMAAAVDILNSWIVGFKRQWGESI